jgi:hypothetical protein
LIVLRQSSWAEVSAQFAGQGDGARAAGNAAGWASRYGLPAEDYYRLPVSLESWNAAELAAAVEQMTKVEPRVSIDIVRGVNNAQLPPRVFNLPATLIRFGERYGILDGKHRVHRWIREGGQYAVLVLSSAHR